MTGAHIQLTKKISFSLLMNQFKNVRIFAIYVTLTEQLLYIFAKICNKNEHNEGFV